MLFQVPLDLEIAPRLQRPLGVGQVSVGDAAKSDRRLRPSLGFLHLRIVAKMNFAQRRLSAASRLGFVERLDGPQRQTALLIAQPILRNPGPLSARTQTNAETGHSFIKDDALGLAIGNRETADICLREPHVPSWEAYGKQPNDRS